MSSSSADLPLSSPLSDGSDVVVLNGHTAAPSITNAADVPRKQVHLPPVSDSNFVIHFRHTDFHVHSFVLLAHSTYFRTYLDTQERLREVKVEEVDVEGKKRRKVTAFTLAEPCAKCGPASIICCIDLPDDVGIKAADEADFLLFLRHLYFSSTLHLPPWVPKAENVSALTDATALCPAFPTTSQSFDDIKSYAQRSATGDLQWSEELLSLFHYFLCQAALDRCDAVIAIRCKAFIADNAPFSHAWRFLSVASRFRLEKAEAACIARVATDGRVRLTHPLYAAWLAQLTSATKDRLIEAFSVSSTVRNAAAAAPPALWLPWAAGRQGAPGGPPRLAQRAPVGPPRPAHHAPVDPPRPAHRAPVGPPRPALRAPVGPPRPAPYLPELQQLQMRLEDLRRRCGRGGQ